MNKASGGDIDDVDRRDQSNTQADTLLSPLLSNREASEENYSRNFSIAMEKR